MCRAKPEAMGFTRTRASPKEELSVDLIPGKLVIKGFIKHKDMF
jgi:hypothetical protein